MGGEAGGVAGALRGHRVVGLDTAPFIYFFEADERFRPVIRPLFQSIESGEIAGVTSTITLTEALVKPRRERDASAYEDILYGLLNFPNLRMRSIDPDVAQGAASLRADYNIRTPDALQMAACAASGAGVFVTNDARLKKVRGIDVVVLKDLLAP